MAGNRIKGITVEIGGDTTKLQTALKGVNTEIRNTQSQLKDVEKLLKLDPGNTELIAQKHRLLAQAVSETREKLETLKTAQQQADDALRNGTISQDQYDALQREIVETEQRLRSLEEQANQSATALQKTEVTASGAGDLFWGSADACGEEYCFRTAGDGGCAECHAGRGETCDHDRCTSGCGSGSGADHHRQDPLGHWNDYDMGTEACRCDQRGEGCFCGTECYDDGKSDRYCDRCHCSFSGGFYLSLEYQ